jgi:hypothetical protein
MQTNVVLRRATSPHGIADLKKAVEVVVRVLMLHPMIGILLDDADET